MSLLTVNLKQVYLIFRCYYQNCQGLTKTTATKIIPALGKIIDTNKCAVAEIDSWYILGDTGIYLESHRNRYGLMKQC